MARRTPLLRLVVVALAACALLLSGAVPATSVTRAQGAQARAAAPVDPHRPVALTGDVAAGPASARRASFAWTGRRITYYANLPAKWRWSLATAVAKWNGAGGHIRFVRTTHRRSAQVTVSYASLGGAAGMATVGRTRHAFVQLSSAYRTVDALDPYYRIEVMMVLAHELGHVLGFAHTHTACSLMAPMLDVAGCHVLPPDRPGYYECRTINTGLVRRFVHIYGGRPRFPARQCLIDPLPARLTGVAFSGGTGTPVTIGWVPPARVPSGSRVQVRAWQPGEPGQCAGGSTEVATAAEVPVGARSWQDPQAEPAAGCYSVQLVNRYGAGRAAVTRFVGP